MSQVIQARHVSIFGSLHFLFCLLSTIFIVFHMEPSYHFFKCLLQWCIISKVFPVHLIKNDLASELCSTYLLFTCLFDWLFVCAYLFVYEFFCFITGQVPWRQFLKINLQNLQVYLIYMRYIKSLCWMNVKIVF